MPTVEEVVANVRTAKRIGRKPKADPALVERIRMLLEVEWLNAGVLEEGVVNRTTVGTPQGGVISPLLANIYLHEVLDCWWVGEVLPRLRGRAFLIRSFEREDDARRVHEVLPQRFARYGLTLHTDKTRLVPFRHPDRRRSSADVTEPEPGTFDFLGFTHYRAKSRKGRWIPKQTAIGRFTRGLRAVRLWMKAHQHRPLAEQAATLGSKLQGHYRHFGMTGNFQALAASSSKCAAPGGCG